MITTNIAAGPNCTVSAVPLDAMVSVAVERWTNGMIDNDLDLVAEEIPVGLEYNGLSHAVMLATAADMEDFAVGFSLTEGIVASRREILDIEVTELASGVRVAIEISGRAMDELKTRRRNLAGRTGCGLCGAESLEQVFRDGAPITAETRYSPTILNGALVRVKEGQRLQAMTGATHAAAWMNADGSIGPLREDVGRHNALDKLIGALVVSEADVARGAVLVTSRASYEMVQKAAAAGIPMLVAVSAPTALAIRTAERLGVTLVGFARQGRHVAYAHAWRLKEARS